MIEYFHVGQIVSNLLEKAHMTKSDLGKAIGMSPGNAVYLTTRETMDVMTLWKIGKALRYNFWKHFPIEAVDDDGRTVEIGGSDKLVGELKAKVAAQEKVIEELRQELVKQEIGFLKEINGLLKKK